MRGRRVSQPTDRANAPSRGKAWWVTLAATALAVAALAWLLHQVDWTLVAQGWRRVPWWVWVLSATGLVTSHVLRAGRIKAEWAPRLRMGWQEAWGLMVRHSAWVVLAPMRGGEAVYVWALYRQGDVPLRQSTLSLLRLRLQDMAVLAVLALALFTPGPWYAQVAVLLALLAVAIWCLPWVWSVLQTWAMRRKGEAGRPMPAPAYVSWAYAVSNWVVKLCAIGLPLWSFLSSSFDAAVKGALGGELAAAMPVQPPAGFGPYEAGVIMAMRWASTVAWTDVAVAALVAHLLALAVTVASATVARLLGWSHRDLRPSTPSASPQP